MTLWKTAKLFDRGLQLHTQRKRGYVKFNVARDDIIRLMRPDLGADTDPDGDGSFFGEDIYDGVGSWAVGVMARGFQGGLASPDTDWIDHDFSDDELAGVDELGEWLQDIKKHVTSVFKSSNFYQILPNMTKDGLSIGSPLAFIEETDTIAGKITFKPQFFKNVFVFYDGNNEHEGVIIEDKRWTVKKIVDEFAPTEAEQAKLPRQVKDDIKAGSYYTEHTMYRFVFKASNALWDGIDGFKKPDAEWISVYFLANTEEEQKNNPLMIEKYFSKPFVVLDIDKKEWESVSRTPAFSAVHDVLSQQDMALDQTTNRKLKNNPPRAVLEDHRNIIDFNPQGITPVKKADWANLPQAIDVVGDIRLSREEMEFNAEKVKRWFRTDQFLKFTDLTNTLRQQPTATQIIKIAAELATQVSPEIAGYTAFLGDIDARIIDIEMRAGRGPFNPDRMIEIRELIAANTDNVNVSLVPVFTGSLARAQQIKQSLDPILEGLGVIGEMSAVWETLPQSIDEHGVAEDALRVIGFPMKRFKSKDEYKEILAQIQAAQQQAQQQQQLIEAAKAAPGVSKNVEENSILANVAAG